ncbi:hypothetical protein O6H91_13G044700 [Diphasiastrum complanatum]|nr:hypothetical protein O6H91_13G044700 [Diphasiastrum complanatum]
MADEMQQLPQVRFIDMRSHSLEKILIDSPVASHVDPIHAPLARHLPHHGVDLNSGELSIFEAESYFKESEPFSRAAAGGVTVPMAVADLGESASIYLSDSDREKESSLLSECCTFNLSESVHELSSNKLTNLLAGKGDAYLPFVLHRGEEVNKNKSNDLDFYLDICSESVKLPNANDLAMDVAMCSNVLNKLKRTDDELSVRISSKAPLSSVYRQMRDPGGGVFWSYGDDTRSSVSSLELKTASSADNQLYSTKSDSPTANSQDEDIPRLSCTDSLPFHLPNLKATLSLGNDIVYPPRSISFRRIFAPSLSSIPYLEDAHVLHPSTNDATARIRRISQH